MANLLDINQIKYNGSDVSLMKFNGAIVYSKTYIDKGYCIEYTLDGSGLLDDENYKGKVNLPRIYSTENTYSYDGYDSIKIILLNGTITTDLSTPCNQIAKVKIYYPEDTKRIAFDNTRIEHINYCKTTNFTTMNSMFYECTNLTNLNVSNWDTSNVTDMSWMLCNCGNLTSIDVSNWNTSNVTNMNHMFFSNYMVESLVELNVSDWDTSNVTDMGYMFYGRSKLVELNVSNWDTSNVADMSSMFSGCGSLTSLDLSNWDTSNVNITQDMFMACTSLAELNLSNFDMTNVYAPSNMFANCTSLHTLRLDNCSYSTISKIITSSDLPTGTIDGVTRTIYCKKSEAAGLTPPRNWVFSYVSEEPEIPLYEVGKFKNNKEITEVRTMVNESHDNLSHMFFGCSNLVSVNTEDWDTSNVTDMSAMFHSCISLTTLDLSSFDTSKVIYMTEVFNSCNSLQSLNLSNWDTSKVTAMNYMFQYCINLVNLDLSSFDMSNVTITNNMFYSCRALTNLQAPRNISADINFSSCTNLTHDSLMSIINNLATISGKTLTLGETNLAKLSEEEKAIATNKGWALA